MSESTAATPSPVPTSPLPQNLPLLYFNGFKLAISSADVGIRLLIDGGDAMELKCSYTSAKSFSEGLAKLVKQLEESTDHIYLTQNEVMAKLMEFSKKSQAKEVKQ